MMSSLATVRDYLVIAYSQNTTAEVEIILLQDANMSNPVFPIQNFNTLTRTLGKMKNAGLS